LYSIEHLDDAFMLFTVELLRLPLSW